MTVDRSRPMTQSAVMLFSALSFGALGACSEPVQRTDLRPDGPPEVLSVLVMNDSVDHFLETATFCKKNDTKRPSLVGTPIHPLQVCDEDLSKGAGFVEVTTDPVTMVKTETFVESTVTDALPTGWYVRIMFDELLDPDVEELIEIIDPEIGPTDTYTGSLLNTQPVTLTCGGVAVPYDGYYSPSGNNVTWPLGPSLFISPLDPTVAATGIECSVTIKASVIDKSGEAVPAADLGPYTFNIAPLQFVGITPEPPADPADPTTLETVSPLAPVIVTFNAAIDDTSLSAAEVVLEQVTTCDQAGLGAARVAVMSPNADGDPTSLDIADAAANTPVTIAASPTGATTAAMVGTFTTTTPHGYVVDQTVVVAGVGVAGYNGTWAVASVVSPTVFTVMLDDATLAASGGGSATSTFAFTPETTYRLTFTDDNVVADVAGGTGSIPGAADLTVCFVTDVAE